MSLFSKLTQLCTSAVCVFLYVWYFNMYIRMTVPMEGATQSVQVFYILYFKI